MSPAFRTGVEQRSVDVEGYLESSVKSAGERREYSKEPCLHVGEQRRFRATKIDEPATTIPN